MGFSEKEQNKEEADFRELKETAARITDTLWRILHFFSAEFRKNLVAAVSLLLVITGYYAFKYHKQTACYEAKASFVYHELHKKTFGEMIDKMAGLISKGDYKTVAGHLGITEQLAAGILDLRAVNLFGSKLSEDITTEKTPFYIIATTRSKSVLDSLNHAIPHYLNNNTYLVSKNKRKNDIIAQEIERNLTELAMLDSLKQKLPEILMADNGSSRSGIDPVTLFQQTISINKDNLEKADVLKNFKSVELLDSFVAGKHPERNSIGYYLGKAGLVFLVGMLLWITARFFFQKERAA